MKTWSGAIVGGCLLMLAGAAAAAVPSVRYHFDGQGRVIGWTESNDQTSTDYDRRGRVIQQTVRSATGVSTYDGDGRAMRR